MPVKQEYIYAVAKAMYNKNWPNHPREIIPEGYIENAAFMLNEYEKMKLADLEITDWDDHVKDRGE